MVIRGFEEKDIDQLVRLHEKYFSSQFDIGQFSNLIDRAFVIEKQDEIICIGGLRSIAEAVLVTDLGKDNITKVKALKKSLEIFSYIARRTGHDSIHAFITDDQWRNHLVNEGFKKCIGDALLLKV